ncbi:MAG: ATP-binding protein [Cyclobacteriaceae bacterium]
MQSPFSFGKRVSTKSFVNRTDEIKRLTLNLRSGINTMIISPRRWGKSSLVVETAKRLSKEKDLRFCFIDMFSISSEAEFYQVFSQEVIKASSTKAEEWLKSGSEMLKAVIPKFSFGVDPQQDFSVSFDWAQVEKHRNEILDLPEKLAKKKKIKIIVCIDEFQNMVSFPNSDKIEKNWRSVWQHQQNVTYCLYGSRRHMISDMFNKSDRAFYRFGDIMWLDKISPDHWAKFITKSFEATGKTISSDICFQLVDQIQNHPYYVQQLSHIVWHNTTTHVTPEILKSSINELITINALFFHQIIDNLSPTQIGFLKAVRDGITQMTAVKTMNSYHMGTPRNISKNRSALDAAEIIDVSNGNITFLDPVFQLWFKNVFKN